MSQKASSKKNCRIVVDAMGGDYAPRNAVLGALEALNEKKDIDVYLVGQTEKIEPVIEESSYDFDKSKIIHASQVIDMGEVPVNAVRTKKDSSIVVGVNQVRKGEADAFVSAGNTGAVMSASTILLGRIKGVNRPTIGVYIPNPNGVMSLYDVGASVDAKPTHLLEYAIMGSIFLELIFDIKNPKVGVLNIGEEENKGNELTLATGKLLKQSGLNFIGNVEGNELFTGKADVIVCDGFVGNVIIKFAEGIFSMIKEMGRAYADKGFIHKLRALSTKKVLKSFMKSIDAEEAGGVPLLGVNGISIIGHGASTAKAIKNMILKASQMYDKSLVSSLEEAVQKHTNAINKGEK